MALLVLGTIGVVLTEIVGTGAGGAVIDMGEGVPDGWATATSPGGLVALGVPPSWESGGTDRHQAVATDLAAWESEYTPARGTDLGRSANDGGIRFTAKEVGVGVWVADAMDLAPVTDEDLERLTELAFVPVGCEAGPVGAHEVDPAGELIGWYTRESTCEDGFVYGQQYLAHPSDDGAIVRIEYVDDDLSVALTEGTFWSILVDLGVWDELNEQAG